MSGSAELVEHLQAEHLNLGVLLRAEPERRRQLDEPLGADRLGLGVAMDALRALTAAHAGLAHASHRGGQAAERRAEALVDVDGAALDLPGDRPRTVAVLAEDRAV